MKIKLPIFTHEILKAEKGMNLRSSKWERQEEDGREYERRTKIKVFFFYLLPFACHILNDLSIICSLPQSLNKARPFFALPPIGFAVILLPCDIDRNTSFVTAIINQRYHITNPKLWFQIPQQLIPDPSTSFLHAPNQPPTWFIFTLTPTAVR